MSLFVFWQGLNADETILSVAVTRANTRLPHIYLFDTRSFVGTKTSGQQPFMEIPSMQSPDAIIRYYIPFNYLNLNLFW